MSQAGRTIFHYHANNGRFADNGFVEAINRKYQKITFCGVGAHHQNSIVENKNRLVTNGARTLLLYGIITWPQMIHEMFWQFSIKAVAERHNSLQVDHKGQTPSSILHEVDLEDIPVKKISYSLLSNILVRCTLKKCWMYRHAKVGTMLAYWIIIRTLSIPRRERCTCLEYKHRESESTVPHSI